MLRRVSIVCLGVCPCKTCKTCKTGKNCKAGKACEPCETPARLARLVRQASLARPMKSLGTARGNASRYWSTGMHCQAKPVSACAGHLHMANSLGPNGGATRQTDKAPLVVAVVPAYPEHTPTQAGASLCVTRWWCLMCTTEGRGDGTQRFGRWKRAPPLRMSQ